MPAAISSWTRLTSATAVRGTVGEITPMPTAPEATSKIVSSPPLKPPSTTSWIVWKTATSTFFSALVSDVLAEVRLVGVDADPAHVLLLRGGEGAEAALARDLEDHVRAAGDLVERELLALRLVDEVLRVGVQGRDPRVRRLRARLVARDVAVDGRDLEPADGADHLLRARPRPS